MAEQKSIWKRYEIPLIVLTTLIFIYFFVVFNQKINFFLGNELIVYLTPQHKYFDLHYGEKAAAEFNVSIANVAYCRAMCQFSFTDRSMNDTIDAGEFIIERGDHESKKYNLSVKRRGSGQDFYSFDVTCRSLPSAFCWTDSPVTMRTSLVTLNYDLTAGEKELKQKLKENLTSMLIEFNDADKLRQAANQKHFELGLSANLENLTSMKLDVDGDYDSIYDSIANLKKLWESEDYSKLTGMLSGSALWSQISSFRNLVADFDRSIDNTANIHNRLIMQLSKISGNFGELNKILSSVNKEEYIYLLNVNSEKFSIAAKLLTAKDFKDYRTIEKQIGAVQREYDSLAEKSKDDATVQFFAAEYYKDYASKLICSLNQECGNNTSLDSPMVSTEEFIAKYPDASLLNLSCISLSSVNESLQDAKTRAMETIEQNGIIFPQDSEFLGQAQAFFDNKLRNLNNSYLNSFEQIASENRISKMALGAANFTIPDGKTNLTELKAGLPLNLSLYWLSKLDLPQLDDLLGSCRNIESPSINIGKSDLKPLKTNISYNIVQRVETRLSDNPSICCVFNDCSPCCNDDSCRNDQNAFPIIFLHGHSFAKDNSFEFSLDAFNKLQAKLQDDGYLNAGIISLYSKNEQSKEGVWGIAGKPVTVKVSYYYDAFKQDDRYIVIPTNSENIDTYALRLRDLIALVKERTGKTSVNIIAHSMGGLVARRYLQIFGDSDVYKLVLIATPNSGIRESQVYYCSLLGESRECDDMKQNSLFMNKLNDPLNQPGKTRIYSIAGEGCKMPGGTGDGVILSSNALLVNSKAYVINSTCEGIFGSSFHTDLLDIDKYPETYNVISGILNE